MTAPKYAISAGFVRSASDGDLHYVGFGALVKLYGVSLAECIRVTPEVWRSLPKDVRSRLIWLGPKSRAEDYEKIRQELERRGK